MPTPENRPDAGKDSGALPDTGASLPVEFIELGLGLELLVDSHCEFVDAVKAAILPIEGEFLFDLPHALVSQRLLPRREGKGRVAAVRMAYEGSETPRVAFVYLSADGAETRVEPEDGQPEHLRNFANSFVAVLERIAHN